MTNIKEKKTLESKKVIELIVQEMRKTTQSLAELQWFIKQHQYLPKVRIPKFVFTTPCGDKYVLTSYVIKFGGDMLIRPFSPFFITWEEFCIARDNSFALPLLKGNDNSVLRKFKERLPYILNCADSSADIEVFNPKATYQFLRFFHRIQMWAKKRLEGLERAQAELERQQKKYKNLLSAEITVKNLEKLL